MCEKIIITGASGFVGLNLSQYLQNHYFKIQPLSLRNNLWKNEIDFNGKAIIHLAGKAHDTKSTSEERQYFNVNTQLTVELYDFFLESNLEYFIYFSSVKAAADNVGGFLDESFTPNPKTPYGISKLKAEEYILSKLPKDDKKIIIVRPCMIHGKGNKGNLNLLYSVVRKGFPYPLASFLNKRSFLSIDNLNFMIGEILEKKEISSGIYNFADDEVLSTNEVVEIIARVLNRKPHLIKIPENFIRFFCKIGDLLHLPLNTENVKKLTENYCVSNDKIKKAIGVDKLPTSAKEGLIKTIASFIAK
ncbi:NAD-dependent epimerase/dehydratase family protein [Flavobacterium psychrophilum]|nr:NAD-dependent epimerase/dehydratase family protein [Flavobacterium psychrophilum]